MDELVDAIQAHQAHLRTSRALEEVQNRRIEQELSLIFRDALEKLVFSGLKGTGRKRECIRAIREGRSDPYSVVDEVLKETLTWNPTRR
jgi:LAO/AO transport system kinase